MPHSWDWWFCRAQFNCHCFWSVYGVIACCYRYVCCLCVALDSMCVLWYYEEVDSIIKWHGFSRHNFGLHWTFTIRRIKHAIEWYNLFENILHQTFWSMCYIVFIWMFKPIFVSFFPLALSLSFTRSLSHILFSVSHSPTYPYYNVTIYPQFRSYFFFILSSIAYVHHFVATINQSQTHYAWFTNKIQLIPFNYMRSVAVALLTTFHFYSTQSTYINIFFLFWCC